MGRITGGLYCVQGWVLLEVLWSSKKLQDAGTYRCLLSSEQSAMQRSMTDSVLETLLTRLAQFYFANPFGLEHLCGSQPPRRVRIEN